MFGLATAITIPVSVQKRNSDTENDLVDGVCKTVTVPEERSNPATSGVWLALHSSTPLILALEQATSPFKEWTTERLFWVISKAEARLVQQLLLISPTQCPDTQIVLSGYRYAVQSKLM
jgi:hypothetical protein